MTSLRILNEINRERARQDEKWGEQNHPDGTGSRYAKHQAGMARDKTELAAAAGTVTWRHILEEEYREALAESDPAKLRAELVQVAAVCAAWIEHIDRRTGGGTKR